VVKGGDFGGELLVAQGKAAQGDHGGGERLASGVKGDRRVGAVCDELLGSHAA
jgi:hypothetical protein